MSFTLQQLRNSVRTHLGVGEEYEDSSVDELINRSFWEIAGKFKFREADGSYDLTTEDGVKDYELETDVSHLQRVSLIDENEKHHQLKSTSLDEFIQGQSEVEDLRGQPTHYARRKQYLILQPTPDDEYTIRLYYRATLEDILADGPVIPREWHEAILYGAISRGFFEFGNINRGAFFDQKQSNYIASITPVEEKELEDTRYAQVQSLRPRYP